MSAKERIQDDEKFIAEEIIKLFIHGEAHQTLENFNGSTISLNTFKSNYSMHYMTLTQAINLLFQNSPVGINDHNDLISFMKLLKPDELFYFINYITPIRSVKKLGEKEKYFFYDSVNYYNFNLVNIFNKEVFQKPAPLERITALVKMVDNLNAMESYSTMIQYGESLYNNFYTNHLLRNIYHYEGDFVNEFIFFMDHNRDMFLYYMLKIYNLKEIRNFLPIFKGIEFDNDSYRLLYERFTLLGNDFYDMPLEWHLELLGD